MAVARDTDLMLTSASFPSSPTTQAFTVGAGSNRVLLVWLNWLRSTTETASITYAGVSMTLVNNYVFSGGPYGSLWHLVAPATGANNLVITHNGTTFTAFIYSANGVDQVTPLGTVSSDLTGVSGVTSTPALAPASAVGDLIVGFLNTNTAITAPAATGTGATLRQNGNDADADGVALFMDQTAAAGTTTGGFSWTGAATGVHVRVAIKADAGAAVYVPYDLEHSPAFQTMVAM